MHTHKTPPETLPRFLVPTIATPFSARKQKSKKKEMRPCESSSHDKPRHAMVTRRLASDKNDTEKEEE